MPALFYFLHRYYKSFVLDDLPGFGRCMFYTYTKMHFQIYFPFIHQLSSFTMSLELQTSNFKL